MRSWERIKFKYMNILSLFGGKKDDCTFNYEPIGTKNDKIIIANQYFQNYDVKRECGEEIAPQLSWKQWKPFLQLIDQSKPFEVSPIVLYEIQKSVVRIAHSLIACSRFSSIASSLYSLLHCLRYTAFHYFHQFFLTI